MSSSNFSPDTIPDQSGRAFFITGGTAGLGAGSIKLIAARNPAHIFFSGRNQRSADELIQTIRQEHGSVPLSFIPCDLTDLNSVQQVAHSLYSQTERLDVFYANAGIMAKAPGLTKNGYEVQFGVNHLGHALLTKLILPLMLRTAEKGDDVRIINMTSIAYKQAPKEGIVFNHLNTTQAKLGGLVPGARWSRYGQSKLANMLYAQELARRYPTIKTVSVHPGYIRTDLFADVPWYTALPVRIAVPLGPGWTPVEEGPYNQTWAGTTARETLDDGAYYVPIARNGELETPQARDAQLAERLWDWTQTELEPYS